jgi:ElaB/YqjD/DUF883 family membrane-anchored ribosome-binding protein
MSTEACTDTRTSAGRTSAIAKDLDDITVASKRLAADSVDAARQTANDLLTEGQSKLRAVQQKVEGRVEKKPVKSLLLAGAVGFVLGQLWKRR